jgi:hypothetical protein
MRRAALLTLLVPAFAGAWSNDQPGNARTDLPEECDDPPYSTHDWIADRALGMLPVNEGAWLVPLRAIYLIGTEAPDNSSILTECDVPHSGYGDTGLGHSVDWNDDHTGWALRDTGELQDRAAVRAQEEYNKTIIAFEQGNHSEAAFYLGAMAHYVGDVSQYGHSGPGDDHHPDYESWVSSRSEPDDDVFTGFLTATPLGRRTPYTAVRRISKITSAGGGAILSFAYEHRQGNDEYLASIGHSLNLAVNELADVPHTFFLNVVEE